MEGAWVGLVHMIGQEEAMEVVVAMVEDMVCPPEVEAVVST